MPRLPIPSDTEDFPEKTRAAVRHILETRKSKPPPSSYLTYAGQAGARLSDLVEHLRYHTSLSDAETELAICTAARAANADYIWSAHAKLGLKAGTREEALHAVDTHGSLDELTTDEALIIRFGRRRHLRGRPSALRRERPDGADGRDERLHDECDGLAGHGPPGGGGRAAFDAAVRPQPVVFLGRLAFGKAQLFSPPPRRWHRSLRGFPSTSSSGPRRRLKPSAPVATRRR